MSERDDAVPMVTATGTEQARVERVILTVVGEARDIRRWFDTVATMVTICTLLVVAMALVVGRMWWDSRDWKRPLQAAPTTYKIERVDLPYEVWADGVFELHPPAFVGTPEGEIEPTKAPQVGAVVRGVRP